MRLELTLPALERLIGGDTELELGLRYQIVEEFTKHHLKTIVNSEFWKERQDLWQAEVKAAVQEGLKDLLIDPKLTHASALVSGKLTEHARTVAREALNQELKKIIDEQKRYWQDQVKREIASAIQANIKQLVEAEIQRRLAAAARIT